MPLFFAAVLGMSFLRPHDGVPLGARPAQGRDHEHALDRRHLRRDRGRLPVGMGRRAPRHRGGTDQPVHPPHAVRHRLRALDGLRGVHALPHPRGVRPHRRRIDLGGRRPGLDRPGHHRRRRHHGRGLRLVRVRGRPRDQGLRPRARRSPCSSTPPSSAWSSCRPRWRCSATGTGGCRAGSTDSSPGSRSSRRPPPRPPSTNDQSRREGDEAEPRCSCSRSPVTGDRKTRQERRRTSPGPAVWGIGTAWMAS